MTKTMLDEPDKPKRKRSSDTQACLVGVAVAAAVYGVVDGLGWGHPVAIGINVGAFVAWWLLHARDGMDE